MILSLALGQPLSVIEAMPAPHLMRYRRFYARHPFGLLRDDLRAWLAGSLPRAKGVKAPEVGPILDGAVPPRRKGPPPALRPGWLREFAIAHGAKIVDPPKAE